MLKAIIGILLGLCLTFIGLDYHGLLGVKKQRILDQIQVVFEPRDINSRVSIHDVHMNCYATQIRQACSEVETGKTERLQLVFSRPILLTRSFLFELSSEQLISDDMPLNLVFIHPDYEQLSSRYLYGELKQMQAQTTIIELTPRENESNE